MNNKQKELLPFAIAAVILIVACAYMFLRHKVPPESGVIRTEIAGSEENAKKIKTIILEYEIYLHSLRPTDSNIKACINSQISEIILDKKSYDPISAADDRDLEIVRQIYQIKAKNLSDVATESGETIPKHQIN